MKREELIEKVIIDIMRLSTAGARIKFSYVNLYGPALNVSAEYSSTKEDILVRDLGEMPIEMLSKSKDAVGLFAGHIEMVMRRFEEHLKFEKNKKEKDNE